MEPQHGDRPHLPGPSLYPIGFAIGVACILVGLIVNPTLVAPTGAVIAVVFGFLWARDASKEYRGEPAAIEPERREVLPATDAPAAPEPEPGERFPRSKFLEASTLGLGAVIGGLVTVPALGFMIIPAFEDQGYPKVDLGPITLYNVDATVVDGAYPREALLGMSFLGRLDMKREGEQLELSQR